MMHSNLGNGPWRTIQIQQFSSSWLFICTSKSPPTPPPCPQLIHMYWCTFSYFALYFFWSLFWQKTDSLIIMSLGLHLSYIHIICSFKKPMWDTFMVSSFCGKCWERVNLFHILSHLLWQVSVCNVCSIQNQKLLLPLCILLTSIIHSKFKQWCRFVLESEQKMVISPSWRNVTVLKWLGYFN